MEAEQVRAVAPDARRNLAWELARLAGVLARHLERQRRRGRTAAADLLQGYVVEEGEADGLVAAIAARWAARAAAASSAAPALAPARPPESETPGCELPLARVVRTFGLDAVEYDAVLMALASELDAAWGRLCGYLNDHVGRTRPTLGLVLEIAAAERAGQAPPSPLDMCRRPVVRDGLLELEGDGPLPGLPLRLSRAMAARLSGIDDDEPVEPGCRAFAREPGALARLVIDDDVRRSAASWAGRAGRRTGPSAPPLVVTGASGSGRVALARAALAEAGLPATVLEIHAGATVADRLMVGRREARWGDAALIVEVCAPFATDAEWEALWRGLTAGAGPVALVVTPEAVDRVVATAPAPPVLLRIGRPSLAMRAALWRALVPTGLGDAEVDQLAARFTFGAGTMARVLAQAVAEAALDAKATSRVDAARLARACRAYGETAMGPLSQKLPLPYGRGDLVLPDALGVELDLARAWIRHQGHVVEAWGFGKRVAQGRGLTALFSGPPGTGKTMAAQVLARDLGVDLFRVDLSRVMSKWIGETEKNLGRLFDDAQAAGVMLFFDEADALFGKRSEVKDAHDRYANVEIGYLLQRMEEHEGITVLASNRMIDMDEAFLRRFHFILDFPMPARQERLRIWQGMFPAEAARAPGLSLQALADRFEISGGEIRNAVLAAAYLAAAEAQAIGMSQLVRALRRELLKNGRVVDEAAFAGFGL
jgi:hypothetical protein